MGVSESQLLGVSVGPEFPTMEWEALRRTTSTVNLSLPLLMVFFFFFAKARVDPSYSIKKEK